MSTAFDKALNHINHIGYMAGIANYYGDTAKETMFTEEFQDIINVFEMLELLEENSYGLIIDAFYAEKARGFENTEILEA